MSSSQSKPTLKLDWCSYEAAKYAVEKWHYSKQIPNQKTVKLGVWEDGRFVGSVVFGDGANNQMLQPYGLTYNQGCELVRVALNVHKSAVSRIVSIALRSLRKGYPMLRLVVSFADPEHSHVGGIYQAGNWIYTGLTTPADEYMVNGVRMHGRALRSTRSTHAARRLEAANVMEWARKVIDPNIQKVQGSVKYRYLYPLDAAMRAQLLPLAKPYPKRAASILSDASGVQPEEGGEAPTAALRELRLTDG